MRSWTGCCGTYAAGQSRVLVLRGEAGVGKSALLELPARARDGLPHRAARRASSRRWSSPFAGLHQLCAPLLDRLSVCPPRSATR